MVEEISDDGANFPADAEDFGGPEADVDSRAHYNFDENHIEVTGIVRGPPRVYTMPTGRQYAIVKLSTTSADRRGSGRFVSFVDVFAPNNIVDYIKDHVREGIQVYVSGQLRSRLRTDEDGRSFQDVRVQANGLFKIVDPKHITDENNSAIRNDNDVNSETKQATLENVAKTQSSA
ncbi:Single-stranded DNA-binding protein [Dirofilaria immitis]